MPQGYATLFQMFLAIAYKKMVLAIAYLRDPRYHLSPSLLKSLTKFYLYFVNQHNVKAKARNLGFYSAYYPYFLNQDNAAGCEQQAICNFVKHLLVDHVMNFIS